jgi:WD40 repeat protein
MALTVSCRCGKKLAVKEEHFGKRVRCPVCQTVCLVPARPKLLEPAPAAPADDGLPDLVPLPEGELPKHTHIDILEEVEDEGTLQIQEGQTESVDLSVAGGIASISLDAGPIDCLAYGPDHLTAVAADEDTVYFLDLPAKDRIPARPMHRDPITCLAISPDSLMALSGDEDGGLLLWDVPRRKSGRWLEGHRYEVTSVAFSPFGKLAVSGDTDGTIRLWNLGTGKAIPLDQARWEEAVNCVCFSRDSSRILAIGSRGKARMWNARTGEVACKMQRGAQNLYSAAFASDGAYVLASSGGEFKVNRWTLPSGDRKSCFDGYAETHPRIEKTLVSPNGRAVLALGFKVEYGARIRDQSPTFTER